MKQFSHSHSLDLDSYRPPPEFSSAQRVNAITMLHD
jgi:hypothetical protein